MSSYEHDGLVLAYSVLGEGTPVLFVHGATGTGRYEWNDLARSLAARHRCVMPDIRGHGRSDFRAADYSGGAVRGDLRTLLRILDLDRPHVVGFSYGAELALMLELETPGSARSLTLLSPGTGRSASYRMPTIEFLLRAWPRALRQLHESRHGLDHWRSLVTLLQEDSGRMPELSTDVLAAVGCQVLMLAGAHDESARRRQGQRFAEVNPRARYLEIADAAHAVH
nr:alpha/beta hydrolase [Micromonospora sp. DSM 115978]